ncbi:hypothetical protein GCM10011571_29990 [Marinithermofilum abyssi]|jgi:DNA-binding FrmR family transcriptional regulator|uniref:DNA-binding transcriptional regulator, FrmR family n=1 Tax=Marinithermofilum abyssi TaxID=1571185 RepID=A0A8J2VGE0_9BACL|nr:metal-sensitive transcriptional regulator [Marinithermofilum abyssi]GGE25860.1 hypothetical protein GCM10011571_29990 [Marinithermofilum abyssi]
MAYQEEMQNRLKRIEGQVRGVLRMMEEGKDCKEVVAQMSAIRSAMNRAISYVVGMNLEQCIREELEKGNEGDSKKVVQEAIELLIKSN